MPKISSKRKTSRLAPALSKQIYFHARAHHHHPIHVNAGATASRLAKENPGRYSVLKDLHVYRISAPDAARNGLRYVRPDGRILLIRWSSGLLAQVDVHEKDNKHSVARMITGTMALELLKATSRLRQLSHRGKAYRFETRVLSVPSIHLFALWKHRPTKCEMDGFIPLTVNFVGLKRRHVYSRAKVDALVRQETVRLIVRWYEQQQATLRDRTSQ